MLGGAMKINVTRICAEAGALANQSGLEGLSMSSLAEALKIRTPSLYSHVAGIADVRRILALHGLAELERGAARSTVGKSGPEAVRALLTGYRDWVRRNPGIYEATVPTPDSSDVEWREAVDRLSETCVSAMQGYGLHGDEAIHALRAMRSVVHGFVSLEAAGAMRGVVERDASFAWLVESFLLAMEYMASRGRCTRDEGDPGQGLSTTGSSPRAASGTSRAPKQQLPLVKS
jgi:AcrR family transcriptional regulator